MAEMDSATTAANDSPYWPACMRDPGFLPWLSRFMAIVNNTRADTPTHALVHMAQKHGPVPPDWGLAVLFLVQHVHGN
jgi:hypothetical protein